jgi:rare lipoprotein A
LIAAERNTSIAVRRIAYGLSLTGGPKQFQQTHFRQKEVCAAMQCATALSYLSSSSSNPHRATIEYPTNKPQPAFSNRNIRSFRRMIVAIAHAIALTAGVFQISEAGATESGLASVYAYSGARTASGASASSSALTAAHRTLPFGTMVQVTNERNGRSVTVRINDRGPFVRGRIIDVTPAAARSLGFSGVTKVTLTVLGRNSPDAAPARTARRHEATRHQKIAGSQ